VLMRPWTKMLMKDSRTIARPLLNLWIMLIVAQFMLKSSPPKYQVVDTLWKIVKRLIATYALSMVLLIWNFNSMRKVSGVNFPARTRKVVASVMNRPRITQHSPLT